MYVGDRKQRLFLALLLLAESRPVTMEELIDKIWGESPIVSARKVLQHYASELRSELGRDMLPKYESGYRVLAARGQVDAHRFRALVKEARPLLGRDDEQAVRLLRQALREWGTDGLMAGEPLDGLRGQCAVKHRAKLRAEHRATTTDCLEAELRLGLHTRLIPEIADALDDGPPDERLGGLLMLAYYRAGRQADALAAFAGLRQRLADELDTTPGKELVRLHHRILQQDPELDLHADPPGSTP
ncbi:AfsR/SARP family transcriptional regulator [Nonomuraea rhizosphaerae]|uniref:AfsR/SARP family transcriptional regulator n=1 Tax=Nonomuraea rhizosphaerae TaxID=2665663 RepID=UPI001C5DBBF8|nr:AfsR/SARP family transcriptional regulator [Nonomuraea rhizosphaerae]